MSATRPPSFDERYAAPVEASRRGAHRARPNPLTSILPVVAGVAVVLLVVVGAWALLGNRGGGSGATPPAAAGPSQSATPTTGSEVPAPSVTPSASASAPASPGAEETGGPDGAGSADVDRAGTEVRVLNSVGVAGLAKTAADVLEGKDWGIGKVGDSKQKDLETTRVYYEDDEGQAIAEAIVADLGYGAIKKSPGANAGSTGFTVVLGQDAADAEDSAN